MIPLFPVFLAVLLVIWVLAIGLGVIVGFFCGPAMMAVNYVNCNSCMIVVCCPLFMVIGAIVAFFSIFCLGMLIVCSKCK